MPTLTQLYGTPSLTRDGWARALLSVVSPATRLAALGPARQPVSASSNDSGATWLELVARPLWGLAAHAAGGGRADEQWDEVRRALLPALDPSHDWYAGPPTGQRLVESAAIGYAVRVAPHELWDPLTGRERDVLTRWLTAATESAPHDNNWHFFPVLAGLPLGITSAAHLNRLEEFALSDGWYRDGDGGGLDYYNPFAFHWYSLMLAALGALEPDRAARLTERSAAFAAQFQHWFAADGSAVPFGRSLGYRFAQGAFWGALAFADCAALRWSEVRGLADRHLAWWWERPIAHSDGLLSVGYGYPNGGIVEQYMGAGSPYWATKFFLPLALPPSHPFWTSPSASLSDGVSSQPTAVVIRHGGDVVLLNGQGWRDWARGGAAKYAKFAYSTRAGFSVPAGDRSLAAGAFDSMLALSDDGGRRWRAREEVDEARVEGDTVWARWSPWPDVTVETLLAPLPDGWHLRRHRLVTARPLSTAEGAFAVPDGLTSVIIDLDDGREHELVTPFAGTNVLHPRTVLPTLRGDYPPGEHVLNTAVYLGDGPPVSQPAI